MHYEFKYDSPHKHLVHIKQSIEGITEDRIELQLPVWRPGRYALGNFAQNLKRLTGKDETGEWLKIEKVNSSRWKVDTSEANEVYLEYYYYADRIDAGSTYIDEELLYVNPVNCCLYMVGREEEEVSISLDVPPNMEIATAMERTGQTSFKVTDMQELMDSPFIASSNIIHHSFEEGGVLIHLWFQGESKPELDRIENDFRPFIKAQLRAFSDFPVPEYHFFYLILPYSTFHGVEHCNSTVITLGPSYDLMKDRYDPFLAVSSHEFYHTWNIKQIRPKEMLPYDLSKPNFSRLGYIAEGVTTYMGDHMLFRSGTMDENKYLTKIGSLIQRHFDNFGRWNISLSESSYDTWIVGYSNEVPHRKVSIYNEGALIAFMLDVLILKNSKGQVSLDQVMDSLYQGFAKRGIGYTEQDLLDLIKEVSGISFKSFFNDHVWGTVDYEPKLRMCLEHLGLVLDDEPSGNYHEAWLGFRISNDQGFAKVIDVHPGSIADIQGLAINDRILAINGYSAGPEEVAKWTEYFSDERIGLTVERRGERKEFHIRKEVEEPYFRKVAVKKLPSPSEVQIRAFKEWRDR